LISDSLLNSDSGTDGRNISPYCMLIYKNNKHYQHLQEAKYFLAAIILKYGASKTYSNNLFLG
jgi:hypothetical protein